MSRKLMTKDLIVLISLISLVLVVPGCVNTGYLAGAGKSSQGLEKIPEKTAAVVSEVIDGDTIKLQTGETVRLLGINTPEKGQPYYEESKNRLKELVENKEVSLEKDVDDRDQYGRLLGHVFLESENINVKMLNEGLATVYIIPPNMKYETELKEAENQARLSKTGLWTPPSQEPEGDGNVCDSKCIGISYFRWNAEGDDCENLNGEYVVFRNSCPYSCDLAGWTVKDESARNPYVFPDNFVLETQTTATLYTGCGTNTQTQLYWCSHGKSCNSIWNNEGGDTLYLRNQKGELVLSHHYEGY